MELTLRLRATATPEADAVLCETIAQALMQAEPSVWYREVH